MHILKRSSACIKSLQEKCLGKEGQRLFNELTRCLRDKIIDFIKLKTVNELY